MLNTYTFWSDAIKEYGTTNSDGKYSVAYGVLFDKTANTRAFFCCWPESTLRSTVPLQFNSFNKLKR